MLTKEDRLNAERNELYAAIKRKDYQAAEKHAAAIDAIKKENTPLRLSLSERLAKAMWIIARHPAAEFDKPPTIYVEQRKQRYLTKADGIMEVWDGLDS